MEKLNYSVYQDLFIFGSLVLFSDEKVLVQGVVDCAIIEEGGITVLDFFL